MFSHKWCSVIGKATLMSDTLKEIIQAWALNPKP
jgi:hypothetical protein